MGVAVNQNVPPSDKVYRNSHSGDVGVAVNQNVPPSDKVYRNSHSGDVGVTVNQNVPSSDKVYRNSHSGEVGVAVNQNVSLQASRRKQTVTEVHSPRVGRVNDNSSCFKPINSSNSENVSNPHKYNGNITFDTIPSASKVSVSSMETRRFARIDYIRDNVSTSESTTEALTIANRGTPRRTIKPLPV